MKHKMLKILSKDYNQEYWRTFYFAVSQSDADSFISSFSMEAYFHHEIENEKRSLHIFHLTILSFFSELREKCVIEKKKVKIQSSYHVLLPSQNWEEKKFWIVRWRKKNLNSEILKGVCVCVCVCMFMWFMRTHICIITWVWHRYYKEKVIYEDIFSVTII